MTGNIETLQYRSEKSISLPSRVTLDDGNLWWTCCGSIPKDASPALDWSRVIPSQTKDGSTPYYKQREIKDALRNLVKLRNASDEQILAFAVKHGVLVICPQVLWENSKHKPTGSLEGYRWYCEPVSVYRQLAAGAGDILAGFRKVKQGKTVQIEEVGDEVRKITTYPRFSQNAEGEFSVIDLSGAQAYLACADAAQCWAELASYRFGVKEDREVWDFEDDGPIACDGLGGAPAMWLTFGHWYDGDWWDIQRVIAGIDWNPDNFPLRSQRPSPLFNVLTFQLQQEIVLPEDTFFCGFCHKPYQHTYEMGNRPRQDRVSFCKPDCELEYKRAYDRERKRKSALLKRTPQTIDNF